MEFTFFCMYNIFKLIGWNQLIWKSDFFLRFIIYKNEYIRKIIAQNFLILSWRLVSCNL